MSSSVSNSLYCTHWFENYFISISSHSFIFHLHTLFFVNFDFINISSLTISFSSNCVSEITRYWQNWIAHYTEDRPFEHTVRFVLTSNGNYYYALDRLVIRIFLCTRFIQTHRHILFCYCCIKLINKHEFYCAFSKPLKIAFKIRNITIQSIVWLITEELTILQYAIIVSNTLL